MGLGKYLETLLKSKLFFNINFIFWLGWLLFGVFRKITKKYIIYSLPLQATHLTIILLIVSVCFIYILKTKNLIKKPKDFFLSLWMTNSFLYFINKCYELLKNNKLFLFFKNVFIITIIQ